MSGWCPTLVPGRPSWLARTNIKSGGDDMHRYHNRRDHYGLLFPEEMGLYLSVGQVAAAECVIRHSGWSQPEAQAFIADLEETDVLVSVWASSIGRSPAT